MNSAVKLSVLLVVLWVAPTGLALAQEGDSPSGVAAVKPLAAKQDMILDRIRRLEDRMFRLQEKLTQTEPENAAKLARALERMGQAGIEQTAEQLMRMLADDAQLARAADVQDELLAELEDLLGVLLARGDADTRGRRIRLLEQHRREIARLLAEQQRLREEATQHANAGRVADKDGAEPGSGQPGGHQDIAARQRTAAEHAARLAERMRGSGQADRQDGQQGREDSDQPSSQGPAPGQQNVQQARRNMHDAADDLERGQPAQAIGDQDQAIEELHEARQKLQDELQQLRREERQELLRDLESRFVELHTGQLAVNADTVALHARGSPLSRADRLGLAELAAEQRTLAEGADTCRHILHEEGTTVVFPSILAEVSRDMTTVAGRLGQLLPGDLTQAIQQEFAATLSDLIEAVRTMQEQDQQGQPGEGGQADQDAPLLPGSAELKLLRAVQLRINQRTGALEAARLKPEAAAAEVQHRLEELARRQGEVADIARRMRDRADQP